MLIILLLVLTYEDTVRWLTLFSPVPDYFEFMRLPWFLILMLLAGCTKITSINSTSLMGKYQWHGFYDNRSTIELKSDYTFEYRWVSGLLWGKTTGLWHWTGRRLILHSSRQKKDRLPYLIIDQEPGEGDSLFLSLASHEGFSLAFASVSLYQNEALIDNKIADEYGLLNIPLSESWTHLEISYTGHQSAFIDLASCSSNVFRVVLFEEFDYFRYFNYTSWQYRNGMLIDPSIKPDKYTEIGYTRID